ncbi:hypothetical protein [Marinobacter zhejiangensis]|uniref:Uncharacterized protein n=1 Tax=Marinobacter zhejiangensis TaxID=488535 RepID=A0A1I4RQW9_9GAMM|nr:hypothetical protein [Marinobacter zhejiangensis]SFM54393.1 hypothetical protein SAMN04487963_2889 [Marinobacter zhejiangensis]
MTADAQTAYGIFWAIYAVGFLIFFIMMSRLFKVIPLYGLRTLLLAVLIVLILPPVESSEVAGWWVPAWLHAGYETILGNTEEAARAMVNMGIAGIVMALVWILDLVRYRLVKR